MLPIDLEDCFTDSPQFRQKLAKREEYIGEIEQRARAMAKAARASIETANGKG